MNFIILNIFLLHLFYCLITKEVILEANKKILTNRNFECSILNPLFGYIYSTKILLNLRKYYHKIIPAYKNGCIRDYVNDKISDELSYFLINLFPTINKDDTISMDGTSNSLKSYFLDTSIRLDSIISFGILFANILNDGDEYHDYNLNMLDDKNHISSAFKDFIYELKVFYYKAKELYYFNEQFSLVLLTIHSFMLNILNSEDEYLLYLTTIIHNIKSELLLTVDEFIFNRLHFILETENSNDQFYYDLHKSIAKLFDDQISQISKNQRSKFSPIEYIGISYILEILEKEVEYEKTRLDFIYNNIFLNTIQDKETHLYHLYEKINENEFDISLETFTEMIINSESLFDEQARKSFLPFYLMNKNYKRSKISADERLTTWLKVLKTYDFLETENFLVKSWSKKMINTDLYDKLVQCAKMSNKCLVRACNVLKKTNVDQIEIQTLDNEIYDWSTIFNLLKECLHLQKLDIKSKNFSFEDRLKYYELIEYKSDKIISLNLSNSRITKEDIKIIVKILGKKGNKIATLDLTKNYFGSGSMEILAEALKYKENKITKLFLDSNIIGRDGAYYIYDGLIHTNNKLTHLFLRNNNIRSGGLEDLSKAFIHKNNKLTHLSLSGENFDDRSLEYFSNALKHPNNKITHLYLSKNNIGFHSIIIISRALTHGYNKITNIDLSHNKLTDEGIHNFIFVLRSKYNKLINLDISSNQISAQGVKEIFTTLKHENCYLQNLNISESNLKNSIPFVVETLTSVQCQLESINLTGCNLDKKEIKDITEGLRENNKQIKVIFES